MYDVLSKAWVGVVTAILISGATLLYAKDAFLGHPGISVVYEITGEGLVEVNYATAAGTRREYVTLPWSKEVLIPPTAFTAKLVGTRSGKNSSLDRCVVKIEGETVVSEGSQPRGMAVSCEKSYAGQ